MIAQGLLDRRVSGHAPEPRRYHPVCPSNRPKAGDESGGELDRGSAGMAAMVDRVTFRYPDNCVAPE